MPKVQSNHHIQCIPNSFARTKHSYIRPPLTCPVTSVYIYLYIYFSLKRNTIKVYSELQYVPYMSGELRCVIPVGKTINYRNKNITKMHFMIDFILTGTDIEHTLVRYWYVGKQLVFLNVKISEKRPHSNIYIYIAAPLHNSISRLSRSP